MRTARTLGSRCRSPAWPSCWAHTVATSRCAADGQDLTVAVGISGGVDSAVAAHLLIDQGYRVIGLHVRSWDERDETGQCSGETDRRDAQRVCDKLGIPLHDLDLVNEYWLDVFEPFLGRLESGYTPNPDLPCNVHIKFGPMLEYAKRQLGADLLATGHYARLVRHSDMKLGQPGGNDAVRLARAADDSKDQSYFLATVSPAVWPHVLFPLGNMRKETVRQLADQLGLHVAAKKSSTGLCFVGKRRFDDFVGQYLEDRPGEIRSVEGGCLIDEHKGLWRYTLGQRARIGGGHHKLFVAGKDTGNDTLWVAPRRDHPALYCTDATTFSDVTWATPCAQPPSELLNLGGPGRGRILCRYKVRYSQTPLEWCAVELASPSEDTFSSQTQYYKLMLDDELARRVPGSEAEQSRQGGVCLRLSFLRPQRAVTPGQAVVLYGPMLPWCEFDDLLPSQGGNGCDGEHARATASSIIGDATDAVGMKIADDIDATVICAATIAFPGRSLYEQGVTSAILVE